MIPVQRAGLRAARLVAVAAEEEGVSAAGVAAVAAAVAAVEAVAKAAEVVAEDVVARRGPAERTSKGSLLTRKTLHSLAL